MALQITCHISFRHSLRKAQRLSQDMVDTLELHPILKKSKSHPSVWRTKQTERGMLSSLWNRLTTTTGVMGLKSFKGGPSKEASTDPINSFTASACNISRLKDAWTHLKNYIFSGPITHLLSVRCVLMKILSKASFQKRKEKSLRVSNFHFYWSFLM